MTPKYCKVYFESKTHGRTAGLVVDSERLKGMTTSEISRLFPYSESLKMNRLVVSPPLDTWTEAFFWHQYSADSA